MDDIGKIIEEIEDKVRQTVSDNADLHKELSEKDEIITGLQKQLTELERENKELKEEKQINNLTNIINNCSDISESKLVINDLLKKINRSISIIAKSNNGRE